MTACCAQAQVVLHERMAMLSRRSSEVGKFERPSKDREKIAKSTVLRCSDKCKEGEDHPLPWCQLHDVGDESHGVLHGERRAVHGSIAKIKVAAANDGEGSEFLVRRRHFLLLHAKDSITGRTVRYERQ